MTARTISRTARYASSVGTADKATRKGIAQAIRRRREKAARQRFYDEWRSYSAEFDDESTTVQDRLQESAYQQLCRELNYDLI